MKIPYGISNFKSLREEGYLYIDKTKYIEKLEELSSKYIFFIRPKRFGKSLFLSALAHYYDISGKENFKNLFGDLYIGKNSTALKNSYLVLELDFSGLNAENKVELEKSFKRSLVDSVAGFFYKYKKLFVNIFTSKAYKLNSEREVENGYIDVYLEKDIRMPDIQFEWLLELKYVKKGEREKVLKIKEEGLKQLKKYAESRSFNHKKHIKQALLIFIGKDEFVVCLP